MAEEKSKNYLIALMAVCIENDMSYNKDLTAYLGMYGDSRTLDSVASGLRTYRLEAKALVDKRKEMEDDKFYSHINTAPKKRKGTGEDTGKAKPASKKAKKTKAEMEEDNVSCFEDTQTF